MDNDECAKRSHWVDQEIVGLAKDAVIVGGDGGLVGPWAHHVEGILCLLEEFRPVVEWERWAGAG